MEFNTCLLYTSGPAALERPYEIDLTEIGWNDNLHHAEGILKESMEMAANVYGADRSYYLSLIHISSRAGINAEGI